MGTSSNLIESFPLTIRKTLQKYTRLPRDISNTFYHFTTHEGIEGIVRSGGIRATYRKHMNDNKEFEYSKNIIYKALTDIENCSDLPKISKDISKQVQLNLEIHFNDTAKMSNSFCSCLTCSSDDKKQWKTYAESGHGFALGFNLLQILTKQYPQFQTDTPILFCYPVIYNKIDQLNLVTDLVMAGVKDLKNFSNNYSQSSEDLTKLRDRIAQNVRLRKGTNMSDLTKVNPTDLIDPQAQRVVDFLQQIGLPFDNIIAAQSERNIIGQNLPAYIESLPSEIKKDARYLSKFVVGAGFGLFDYSLNAIWNEVVIDLRRKAIAYGIDIFFDSAVGGKARDFYKTEEDLASLKDAVLLDTCRKLELISDTTYKKLKHILEMRNDIGISHPTNYTINAFELLGWLQTCIQDVLNDRPTEAALQVQAFIQNLKTYTSPIDPATQKTIESKIKELASHHLSSILRTTFGIYVTTDTDPQVRKNISVIAPTIWSNCADEPKYKIGIILEGYNTNLHKEKYQLGEQFFQVVRGNSYRTKNERAIIVDTLLDQLLEKHSGWDNFHHEPPVADLIASYVHEQSDILQNNVEKLVKVMLMCRIGRDVSYCDGVSPRGQAYYE